jgi:hypothetical protein
MMATPPPYSYSLEQWIEYKKFVDAEITKVEPIYQRSVIIKAEQEKKKKQNIALAANTGAFSWSFLGTPQIGNAKNICNVNGLGCKKEFDGSITYVDSDFNRLSEYIKKYYTHNLYPFLEGDRAAVLRFPSFTQIFQNNEHMRILPYYLMFNNTFTSFLGDVNNMEFFTNLYNGAYDKALDTLLLNQEYVASIGKIQYIHENTIDTILAETESSVLCSLNQIYNLENKTQFHTIASVFWRNPGSNVIICGVYDPIYFYRAHTGKNYFFALIAFYINMKLLAKKKGVPIQIINLSQYCYTSAKGVHCPQYVINAEYCNIYSVYFIYCYMLRGYPRTEDGLRQVIRDCFIVEPAELGRDISIPNNIFRITMMSFILTLLVLVTPNPTFYHIRRDSDTRQQIAQMVTTYDRVKATGFSLLQPQIESVLVALKGTTGGRRSHKYVRKTRRKHRHMCKTHGRTSKIRKYRKPT